MKAPSRRTAQTSLRPSIIAGCIAAALLSIQAVPAQAVIANANAQYQAEQITAKIRTATSGVKLGAGEDLVVRSYMTNAQGRTIVRADQTYQGHRVWGSAAVIHADKNSAPQVAAHNLSAVVAPTQSAALSQSKAEAIALKAMALKGNHAPIKADLVLFPTKYMGGIKFALDPVQKKYVIDHKNSIITNVPADPFVWAYEVSIFAYNKLDGMQEAKYVVDANTGAILNVSNELRNLTLPPLNPPTQNYPTPDTAVQGVGYTQYSGMVTLDTTQHGDGTYAMVDISGRASQYNNYLYNLTDANSNPVLDAQGNQIQAIGLQTLAETHADYGLGWNESNFWFDLNSVNAWGDGNQFVMYPYGGETSVNGQTAAADAHYGMAVTWDFYKNVFNLNGLDNNGQSVISVVHSVSQSYSGPSGLYYDGAAWSNTVFGMIYSDGTYNQGVDPTSGQPTYPNPNGKLSMTSIDIAGHEMTHGVSQNIFSQSTGQSAGLGEAFSDIMGQMIQAYSHRAADADNTLIPLAGNDWMIGAQVSPNGTPIRYLHQPSQDGVSVDMWYSGIDFLDSHFSNGPMNRMFYFLSQGAAANESPYLPGGMTGIGNDHAARIVYKAVMEGLQSTSQYADARTAAIKAAYDLYGGSSPEIAAVRQAFAAINVGGPSLNSDAGVSITMAEFPANIILGNYFHNTQMVSMGTTVRLQATVTGALDTSVTWQAGGRTGAFNSPGFLQYGGVFDKDGNWTPDNNWGMHSVTAIANADPRQFCEGAVWVMNGDADGDTQFDAIDLGSVALSWQMSAPLNLSHDVMLYGNVDDFDVVGILRAFKNAFGGA